MSMGQALLEQGLELMIYGMGTVFVFLTVLVIVTTIMSKIVQRFFPDPIVATSPTAKPAPAATNNQQLHAVITAAIHRHRSRQKQ